MKVNLTAKRAPASETPVDPQVKPIPAVPVVREAAAPRQWNRRALAGAVLAVLLGGLMVMLALPAYAHRTDVLVVSRMVRAGQVITAADLGTAKVSAGPDVDTMPATQRASVIGKAATTTLAKGSLLTDSLVTDQHGFTGSQALVGLPLKVGQLPAGGVVVGQRVQIIGTPGTSTAQTNAWATAVIPAVVMNVGAREASTSMTVVDVRLDAAQAANAARLASTGNLALLALPVGS